MDNPEREKADSQQRFCCYTFVKSIRKSRPVGRSTRKRMTDTQCSRRVAFNQCRGPPACCMAAPTWRLQAMCGHQTCGRSKHILRSADSSIAKIKEVLRAWKYSLCPQRECTETSSLDQGIAGDAMKLICMHVFGSVREHASEVMSEAGSRMEDK